MKKSVMFFMFLSFFTNAETISCGGKITVLAYHSPDKFMLQLSSMNAPVFFCSPQNNWSVPGTQYTTGPETCKALYSTFLAAKVSGQTIESMYFDGDDVPKSCNSWVQWSNANIRYFFIKD